MRKNVAKYFKNGFTLTELLVVIAIIGLLAAMVITDFRKGKMRDDLRQAALTISQSVSQVQNMALTGLIVDENEKLPERGYGINIDTTGEASLTSYKIFANVYETVENEENGKYVFDEGHDQLIEEEVVNLPAHVKFSSLRMSKQTSPDTWGDMNIVFVPLEHQVHLCSSLTSNDCTNQLYIELTQTVLGETKLVHINGLTGQVEIP